MTTSSTCGSGTGSPRRSRPARRPGSTPADDGRDRRGDRRDEATTIDALAAMDVAGLIAVWERPEGSLMTLSALAAEPARAPAGRVRPEAGPLGPRTTTARARRRGRRDPSWPRGRPWRSSSTTIPGPDVEAELRATAEPPRRPLRHHPPRRRSGEPPRPTLLIGLGLTPWPGPAAARADRCPACGAPRCRPTAYCLCCDRWGLDALRRRPATARLGPASAGFRSPDRDRRSRRGPDASAAGAADRRWPAGSSSDRRRRSRPGDARSPG